MTRWNRTPVLAAALLAAGCGGRSDVAPPPTAATPAARPAVVELKDMTYAELDKAIAAHKGKVVLADVWATW